MKHYELLYIIPVKFAGEELDKIQKKVKEIITKDGGEIDHEENLGKKKLAYKIKQNTQGFYIVNEFDAEPSAVKSINNKLRLSADVLRHLIISKEKITPEERAKIVALKAKRNKKEESGSMADQFNIENQLSEEKEEVVVEKTEEKVEEKKEKVAKKYKEEVKEEAKEEVEEKKAEPAKKKKEVVEEKVDEKTRLEDLDKKLDEIIDSDLF